MVKVKKTQRTPEKLTQKTNYKPILGILLLSLIPIAIISIAVDPFNLFVGFQPTTTPEEDITPPTIVSTSPVDISRSILETTNIIVDFSETIDPTTINSKTFLVKLDNESTIGDISLNNRTATFNPVLNLENGLIYNVVITNKVKDLAGNLMAKSFGFSFRTKIVVSDQVDYFVANNGSNFLRSLNVQSLAVGSGKISQKVNSEKSVTLNISSFLGYADCGFYIILDKLSSFNGVKIVASNYSANTVKNVYTGTFGVNIWFDKNNNSEFFAWSDGVMSSLSGDAYILGSSATNGIVNINSTTTLTSLNPGGGNYDISQLKSGAALGINGNTKIALWVGINVFTSSQNATIISITLK